MMMIIIAIQIAWKTIVQKNGVFRILSLSLTLSIQIHHRICQQKLIALHVAELFPKERR